MTNFSFTENYLDPATRLGEALFGLIMVLTFTLISGIAIKENPDSARELLVATLGCNIAWGIIDGAFFIMIAILERSQRIQTIFAIKAAPNDSAAMKIAADKFDDALVDLTSAEERRQLYQNIVSVAKQTKPHINRLTKSDLMGAFASCWLVILTTFPAVIPFFFIQQSHQALRVSNFLLIALLFFCGTYWGKYTHMNKWLTGTIFMVLGLALVAIAIALGG